MQGANVLLKKDYLVSPTLQLELKPKPKIVHIPKTFKHFRKG
jgi:hypothetical protein